MADETVVVRGGLMRPDKIADSIKAAKRNTGKCGISVYGEDGMDAAKLINTLRPNQMPHATVRLSTAGAIRRGGFDVIPTGEAPHQTIVFPAGYEHIGAILDLINLFDRPVPRSELTGLGY